MKLLFCNVVNALSENLANHEMNNQLSDKEMKFLHSLYEDNLLILNSIFENISQLEHEGCFLVQDLIFISNTVAVIIKNYLMKNNKKNIRLVTIVKFLLDTLVLNRVLNFPEDTDSDELKAIIRVSMTLLSTNPKICSSFF